MAEAIEGLAAAQERIKQLAQTPGRYLVFSVETKAIVASVDTTKPDTDRFSPLRKGIKKGRSQSQ